MTDVRRSDRGRPVEEYTGERGSRRGDDEGTERPADRSGGEVERVLLAAPSASTAAAAAAARGVDNKRIRSLAVRCATHRRPRTIAAAVVVVAVDETPRRDAD